MSKRRVPAQAALLARDSKTAAELESNSCSVEEKLLPESTGQRICPTYFTRTARCQNDAVVIDIQAADAYMCLLA